MSGRKRWPVWTPKPVEPTPDIDFAAFSDALNRTTDALSGAVSKAVAYPNPVEWIASMNADERAVARALLTRPPR